MSRPVLMLAGTQEARTIAARFRRPDLHLVASLAGVTKDPLAYHCDTRIGGFGGAEGLAAWLVQNEAKAVLDASHPFAERISDNACAAARQAGIPYLCLRRLPWTVETGWQTFETTEQVVEAVPSGKRVLLTTGRRYTAALAGRPDVSFFLRSIEAVPNLPDNVTAIRNRPPYTVASECNLFRERAITHLVTKNSGGARPAKLDAAAIMGVDVFIISPPPLPNAQVAATVEDALDWLYQLS